MADIFLIYKREDYKIIQLLAKSLESYGWTVAWDMNLPAGQTFADLIEREIHAARAAVVFWTSLSVKSRWVIDDANYALELQKLVPVFLERVDPPIGYLNLQHVDLSEWQGETSHVGFQNLVNDLTSVLGISDEATIPRPSIFSTRGGKRRLNEAKLLLVGFGGVGKTSIVNKLVHGKPFDLQEKKTDGIAISDWQLRVNEKEIVHLHVWDFGGQEIMHATHQFFLTMRSLYLLVLNGRQGREDADAEYWLNMLENFAADSPVIVILNKIREVPFDVNRRALQGKFPNIKRFIKTDCSDGSGLDDLRRFIQEETDQLPHVHDAYPATWFVMKDRLEKMKESYLTFNAFRRMCAKHGEVEEEGQERLADFLHVLGVALNYRQDPRLLDTHVLKPSWVTEGIYSILNAKRLAANKGELKLSELSEILIPKQYPRAQHFFLIELMRKFELCFRFPEEEDRFLVPELLDKQEPEEVESFASKGLLTFEYHYSGLLPEGLLPRFIVRTSGLSTDQPRWRTGVVLSFEGNHALVKGDSIERKVRIAVDGPHLGRRRLLAVIRTDFEHIHKSYAFRPDEMVPVPGYNGVVIPYKKLLVMERAGVMETKEVFGDEVLTLNVRELLDGVDLEGIRATLADPTHLPPLSAFISYSHKDAALRAEMETHLKLLKRQGLLELWSDRHITAGSDWERQIDENLERADVILLLVSADFIASGYCWGTELKRALERHNIGDARVIPIIVRECSWKSAPFGELEVLPDGGKPVTTWGTGPYAHDTPWTKVEDGIRSVVNELRENKSRHLK